MRAYINAVAGALLLSLVFLGLEQLVPVEKGQRSARRIFNLAYFPCLLAAFLLVQEPFTRLYAYCVTFVGGGLLSSFVQSPGNLTAEVLLILVFGVLTPRFIAAFIMFRPVFGFINHANIRIHLGGLTPIITGPQWHRIHHSTDAQHRDKNFAAIFPFIDIVFGTYYSPNETEYPPTGLRGEDHPGDFRAATLEPLLAWYRIARRGIRRA